MVSLQTKTMRQPISLSIQINSPCQENWENMNPTEQGTSSIKKTIANLINSFFVDKEGIGQDRILLIDPQLRKSNSAEVIIEFAPKERN